MAAPAALPIKTISPQQESENLYREAMVLTQQGRGADAMERLHKAVAVYPANSAARKTLASAMMQRGEADGALALLEDGRRLAPSDADLSAAVARVELERGNTQRAQDLLDELSRAGKSDAGMHAMQAVALQRLGKHSDAVPHFLAALQTNPAMPNWLVGLGISLRATGQDAQAAEAFQRARGTGLLSPELTAFVDQQLRSPVR